MDDSISIDEFYGRFAPIVSHVDPNQVQALLNNLSRQSCAAGEVLLNDGEESDALYLLWDGLLSASISEDTEAIELGKIVPGQWVGEVSMIDPGPATATVVAEKPSTVLKLDRAAYQKLEKLAPQLTTHLLHGLSNLMAERMRSASEVLYSRHHHEEAGADVVHPDTFKPWLVGVYRKMIGIAQS